MTYHFPIEPNKLLKAVLLGITLMFLLGFCSCSPSWHIRQAQRKAPELFKDTLETRSIDTLLIEVPKVDTVLKQLRDTLIEYRQGEVKIKYLWNTKTDSIYIEADCPDTEVITETVVKELPPIVLEPTLWDKIKYGLLLTSVILIILILKKLI